MPVNFSRNIARDLKRRLETRWRSSDGRNTFQFLEESLASGHLKPDEFSIRALAEELVPDGHEWVRAMDPRSAGGFQILEAADVVSAANFSNISGQVVYSKILDAANMEDLVFSAIIPTQATSLDGEKIPGIGNIGDHAQAIGEGQTYPHVGVGEDYIETPHTTKRGMIVPVTKEAIFFDRTGQVLNRCSQVGQWLAINKEKRLIDCVIDENITGHRYKWRGTTIATYDDNSGTHSWDNLAASNGLVDWTDIDAAEQVLAGITDPNTSEPMPLLADTLIVTPENRAVAFRIMSATQIALQAGGFATSGNLSRTDAPSPIGRHEFSAPYRVVSSRLLKARMGTDTTWYLGRPSAAFVYMENWPITVIQAPTNSEAEFERDIVVRYKASERGAAATLEPRYMVKNTA